MKGQRQILVVASELRKKKVAGVGEDVGRGGVGTGTAATRVRRTSGSTANKKLCVKHRLLYSIPEKKNLDLPSSDLTATMPSGPSAFFP
jgi:hypothetical protein